MSRKLLAYTTIIAAFFGILAGCDSNNEQQRSVVSVASVNFNGPVISDVLEQGDSVVDVNGFAVTRDDFLREDWLPILFYNRPYNEIVTTAPGEPGGDVLLTGYEIRWSRDDGGPVLPTFFGSTSILLLTGVYTDATIRLVTFANKSVQFISDLCYLCPNAGEQIEMVAHITFTGHELGSEREVFVNADVGVSFVDLVVATEDN